MEVAKNMDSVFAGAMEDDFDVMFDVEDSLIDAVNGYNEAGDPLTGVDFEDLHQTQDDATVDDVRDYDADDEPMGNNNAEGTKPAEEIDTSVKGEENKESDGDKFINNAEDNYQEDKEKDPNIVDNDVNKNIENVIESKDLDNFMLDDDEDEDILSEKKCCKESDEEKEEPVDEGCKKNVDEAKGGRTSKQMAADMVDSDKEPAVAEKCCKEEGDILSKVDFEDLHQTQDDATVKDVENYDAEDSPMGAKDAEGTTKEKIEDAPAEGKVQDSQLYTDKTDVKIDEEVNITVDDLESEIKKEADKVVKEATLDAEVEKIDDEDLDDEDDLIDVASGKKASSKASADKYSYDFSDEDLIDMAMNS